MYLNLDNVTKVFPGRSGDNEVTAVDNITIHIEKGELVTLLGPSGCGKTTTLRMIAGFEFPTNGDIYLDGQEINNLPPHKRDMSMVFQSYAIFPHLNVYENVAYGLKVAKLSKSVIQERVKKTLALVELSGYENRAPNQLSGGQQQRVALARALIMEPKVLLMDEPCSTLDPQATARIEELMRELKENYTIIIVTHNMQQAARVSDDTGFMLLGEMVEFSETNKIFTAPKDKRTEDYVTGRFG